MALKVLMLRKKMEEKQKELLSIRSAAEGFAEKEAALEQAIGEAETDEEKQAVEQAVEAFEVEKEQNGTSAETLESEISSIEQEIGAMERAQKQNNDNKTRGAKEDMPSSVVTQEYSRERARGKRFFDTVFIERRNAIVSREEVKAFLGDVRSVKNRRSLCGAELTIPTVMLDLIRENIERYSKLIGIVRMRPVPGETRQNVMGTIPEAVWTEMCTNINELSLGFAQVTLDGYKIAGYIPICNSIMEDSDINLAAEIIEALGQSIGVALDKAILYGKGAGSKMPLGIVTRLAQTTKPIGHPDKAPEWKNLSSSNLIKMDATLADTKFFAEFVRRASAAKSKYASDGKFWAMNESTFGTVLSKAITFNASGAVVSQINGTMPIVNGTIVLLDFIPDGDIIGGYGDLYLLAQRAGVQIDQSEHVMFLQDNTVFRAKARYDGMPVIPEGFVALNINGVDVTTAMAFPPDDANKPDSPSGITA